MITRKTLIVAIVAALAVLAPLAALRPMAQAQAKTETQPQTHAFVSATTTDTPGRDAGGVTVQLIGVAIDGASSAPAKSWWDASGHLLPKPLPISLHDTYGDMKHTRSYTIAFRVKSPGNVPVNLLFEPTSSFVSSSDGSWVGKMTSRNQATEAQIDSENGGYRVLNCGSPVGMTQNDIRVGIGEGPWITAATNTKGHIGAFFGTLWENAPEMTCIFSPLTSTDNGSVVTISLRGQDDESPAQTHDLRIVAVDRHGNERLPDNIDDESSESLEQVQAHFALPPASIRSVRLETRPYHWITFRNVSLRPRSYVESGISQKDEAAEISGLTGKALTDFKAYMKEMRVYDKQIFGSKDVSAEEAKRMTTKDLITQTNRLQLFLLMIMNDDPKVGLYRAYQCSNSMAELLSRKDFNAAFLQAYSSFDTNPKTNPHFEKDGGLFATGWMLSLWDYPPLQSQSEGHEKEILSALCKKYREMQKVNASYPKGQDPYGQGCFPLGPAQQFAKKVFPNARILSVHSMKDVELGVKELEHL